MIIDDYICLHPSMQLGCLRNCTVEMYLLLMHVYVHFLLSNRSVPNSIPCVIMLQFSQLTNIQVNKYVKCYKLTYKSFKNF